MKKNVITINEIIKGLETQAESVKNPYKKRYTKELNDVIINMLEYVDLDSMEVEPTANGFNRGTIGENLIKYHALSFLGKEVLSVNKSLAKTCDLDLRRAEKMALAELGLLPSIYEVKTLTKLANAHASNHETKNYIILDLKKRNKVVLTSKDKLVMDNSGHVTGYTDGVVLEVLSELLGL